MLKLRLHGELSEINQFAEFLSTLAPNIRILSCSENYKDRGASVYCRAYLDIELNTLSETTNKVPSGSVCCRKIQGRL